MGTERKRWLQEAAQAHNQQQLQLAANGAFATGGGGGRGGRKVDLRDESQNYGGPGSGQQARGAEGGRVLGVEETEKTQVCQCIYRMCSLCRMC